LRHPLRIRILEIVNERDMSPTQFMRQRLAPDVEVSAKSLSQLSYHFRALEKAGCIEVVDRVPRRGATEHVYRGKARAYFTDEEWEALTPRERCLISRTMYQGLAARVEGAIMAHTFDSRTDRHLTWIAMEVDERGWTQLMGTLASTFGSIEEIRHDARDRLAGSGDKVVPVTVGMLGFESPAPPPLLGDGDGRDPEGQLSSGGVDSHLHR
jgi:DNA-binding transcriptional ArsR family regulator